MTDNKQTCEDRIDSHLADEAERFTAYMSDSDIYEEGSEELGIGPFYEYGLAFDYVEPNTFNDQPVGYYRYQLSWGGPSDEIRFYPDGKIKYWFLDWFDGASRDITGEAWAQWLHDMFKETESINWGDVEAYCYE